MTAIVVRSPAKINLALLVGPPRPDGFHELASVYQAVGLYDEVVAAPAEDGDRTVSVEAVGDGIGADLVPVGPDNLAVRAAELLADTHDVAYGAALHIRKGIPVAGGLAGGSSDAAATLVACNELWGLGVPVNELVELAGELGSDVPFCLLGSTAIGTGHGEIVTPALARGHYHWVLALSEDGMSTPRAYAELDRLRAERGEEAGAPRIPDELMAAVRSGDAPALGRALVNELQEVAVGLRPSLGELLEAGEDYGALGALVSGSGPTCLFLAADGPRAVELATRLDGTGLADRVVRTSGPVPGASVLDATVA